MIFLLRHGETLWNREGRGQGRGDSPLTLRGIAQARAYGRALRGALDGEEDVELFASPLFRAWQTAVIVAETAGRDASALRPSPLLAELDCGAFQGLTRAEIETRHPGLLEARRREPWTFVPPGGESRESVHARARRWLDEERCGKVAVVVAHGIVSRVLRGAWLGLGPREIEALPPHHHGRLFRLCEGRAEEIALDPA